MEHLHLYEAVSEVSAYQLKVLDAVWLMLDRVGLSNCLGRQLCLLCFSNTVLAVMLHLLM